MSSRTTEERLSGEELAVARLPRALEKMSEVLRVLQEWREADRVDAIDSAITAIGVVNNVLARIQGLW